MQVRDGMSETVLTVGPGHTLREAARLMSQRKVGAAIVIDPEQPGPGILTERDMLDSLGAGQDPDIEKVGDHLSATLTFAAPDWSLERAAEAMVRGGFRHLVIVDGGETVGVLSMRDIVRCWTDDGASCDVDDKLSALLALVLERELRDVLARLPDPSRDRRRSRSPRRSRR